MKKEKMLIIIITIAAICMTAAAVLMYLTAPDPEQPVMRTGGKQGIVLASATKMTGANNPEAKNVNHPSLNLSAPEKTVQEFRAKTASLLHVTGEGTSTYPSPEDRGEAVPAQQNKDAEQRWNTASAGQGPMPGRDNGRVPENSVFASRPDPRHQLGDTGPSPGRAGEGRSGDETPVPGAVPESGQQDGPSFQSVSVSRSLSEDGGSGEIKVTLSISLGGVRPNGLIVKEYIPKGWEVSESTLPYRNYDRSTGEIKWLLMGGDIRSTEIGYRVVKKEAAEAEAAFHGNYLYNSANGQRVTMQIDYVGGV
ncbi:MAG: hypothetical protein HZA16_03980 [Nitrospirae bacterium]|nr:hypothetical protein [Nitrospirota bacterium]